MTRRLLVGLFAVAFLADLAYAQDKPKLDFADTAKMIDNHLAAQWKADKVVPSPPSDDAEFCRRVWLDIGGKLPPVSETRDFLNDKSPDKRARLVDRLLSSPHYIVHFTDFWRAVMMPEADADLQARALIPGFDAWLRQKLFDDVHYDSMVRELLTTPLGALAVNQAPGAVAAPQPFAYYQSKELKPENLAAGTARMFLGVRLECAQCHNHPFDHWKQEEFWSFAAFFAGIQRTPEQNQGVQAIVRELFDRQELTIPGTKTVVTARYLGGGKPEKTKAGPRAALADWIASPSNPYFARAAANRLWGHFFGAGIVEPVDDFGSENPASHPELLDQLAQAFVASGYDTKFLIRAICASQAYQLSGTQTDESQKDPRKFARMNIKGLSPEQLFDSLAQATGFYQPFTVANQFNFGAPQTERDEFLETFANSTDPITERQTTILQALTLMNGTFVAKATSLEQSSALAAIAECPWFSPADQIEAIYLTVLVRRPRPDEAESMLKYITSPATDAERHKALGDVYWALLNSSEFLFNH